jgi:hypothetical protein
MDWVAWTNPKFPVRWRIARNGVWFADDSGERNQLALYISAR